MDMRKKWQVLGFHTMNDQRVEGNSLLLGCGPSQCVGTQLQIPHMKTAYEMAATMLCMYLQLKNSDGCQI